MVVEVGTRVLRPPLRAELLGGHYWQEKVYWDGEQNAPLHHEWEEGDHQLLYRLQSGYWYLHCYRDGTEKDEWYILTVQEAVAWLRNEAHKVPHDLDGLLPEKS